jgi:hypothetical protein
VTKADNLRKFASGYNSGLNRHDIEALEFVLFRTGIGRGLRELQDRSGSGAGVVMDAALAASADRRARDLVGHFYIYHGCYVVPDHFLVRAISVELDVDGLLAVEERLLDSSWLGGREVHAARGFARMLNGQAQFLTVRQDKSVGFNLIVGDQLTPRGPLCELTGEMLGMTKHLLPFRRAVLMIRAQKDVKLADMVANTGVKQWREWSSEVQERFRQLARHYPRQQFEDPVLTLAKS